MMVAAVDAKPLFYRLLALPYCRETQMEVR